MPAAADASADRSRARTLYGLQYLRAIAACAVVLFHASTRTAVPLRLGEAGVDLFFVLSGFLMIVITTAETRPVAFLADRIRRIVPAYWIATAAMIGAAALGLSPGIRLTGEHIATSLLFIPASSPSNGYPWPLLVQGWTLNMEMFFYAIFAVLLALAPRRWQLPSLTLILGALVAVGLVSRPYDALGVTYTHPMLLEFAAGGWLGMAWKRHGAPWQKLAPALFATAVLLLALNHARDGEVGRPIIFGIPALLLLAATLGWEHRPGGIARFGLPALLGDASYSIYLWHTFAISVTHQVAVRLALAPAAEIMLGAVAGVTLGIGAYLAIERPILRLLRQRRVRHGVPVPAGP